jgi:flavodoxin
MYHAALIYAPATAEMDALAELIVGKLAGERVTVVRKPARDAAIPDLAAADLVLLGSTAGAAAAIHEDFAEILRALDGISLAGRSVGVFALGSESTISAFAEALKDCEIALPSAHRLLVSAPERAQDGVGPWLSTLLKHLEARRNDG